MSRPGAKTEPDLFTLPRRKIEPRLYQAGRYFSRTIWSVPFVCWRTPSWSVFVVNEVARRGPPTPPLAHASDPSDERERRVRTSAAPRAEAGHHRPSVRRAAVRGLAQNFGPWGNNITAQPMAGRWSGPGVTEAPITKRWSLVLGAPERSAASRGWRLGPAARCTIRRGYPGPRVTDAVQSPMFQHWIVRCIGMNRTRIANAARTLPAPDTRAHFGAGP